MTFDLPTENTDRKATYTEFVEAGSRHTLPVFACIRIGRRDMGVFFSDFCGMLEAMRHVE
jgi:hypothetical protein